MKMKIYLRKWLNIAYEHQY